MTKDAFYRIVTEEESGSSSEEFSVHDHRLRLRFVVLPPEWASRCPAEGEEEFSELGGETVQETAPEAWTRLNRKAVERAVQDFRRTLTEALDWAG